MTVAELIERLGEVKEAKTSAYEAYKSVQTVEDDLKSQLVATLRETGLKSAKGQNYQASLSERSDIVVTHESSVIEWLNNEPDVEHDVYIGLKTTAFKTLAKEVLKTTGEIIPGTETRVTESLSIKANKK